MKTTAPKRLGSIIVLSLLALLAIAVGAQAVLAASSSLTPAAGTQGRGGVSASSSAAIAVTPTAGTEGRGGADASVTVVAVTTPAAGSEGRGGVAALAGPATLAGETTVAGNGFSLRARGGVPRPAAGAFAAPSTTAATTGFGVWVIVGIAVAVLLVAVAAWASFRRRSRASEKSLAAYCAQHAEDAMCMTA